MRNAGLIKAIKDLGWLIKDKGNVSVDSLKGRNYGPDYGKSIININKIATKAYIPMLSSTKLKIITIQRITFTPIKPISVIKIALLKNLLSLGSTAYKNLATKAKWIKDPNPGTKNKKE